MSSDEQSAPWSLFPASRLPNVDANSWLDGDFLSSLRTIPIEEESSEDIRDHSRRTYSGWLLFSWLLNQCRYLFQWLFHSRTGFLLLYCMTYIAVCIVLAFVFALRSPSLSIVAVCCVVLSAFARIGYLLQTRSHMLRARDGSGEYLSRIFSNRSRGILPINSIAGINRLHLGLSLVDRDFSPEDYETLIALDEVSVPVRVGASQSQINLLPEYIYKGAPIEKENSKDKSSNNNNSNSSNNSDGGDNGPPNCPICLDELQGGCRVRILTCFHQFHADCVDRWLSMQTICPVCKTRVFQS